MSDTPILRLGGLASGMDTDSVVSQLMAVEKLPQTRILQQKTVEQARQNALKDVQTRLTNLQTAAAAVTDSTIWGDTQTVDSSDTSHITATRTGGAPPGGYLVEVSQLARAAQSTSTSLSSVANSGTLTIQVGAGASKDVSVNAGESLQAVADRINGTQDMGVYASVSNGRLVLAGKTTGDGNAISVTGSAAADFGFAETTSARSATVVVGDTVGADGHISGGTTLHPSSNIVTDALPGITLTLRGLTPLGAPAGITVGQPSADTDAIKDKVQALVDQYNSTVGFIRSKLNEQKVPNASTDADRAKGLLQGDSGLTSILSQLRRLFSDPVTGRPADLSQLSQAGLSTGAPSTGGVNQDAVDGKLTLDTAKLTTMLQTRPDDVKALFTNTAAAGYGGQGLGQRLAGALSSQLSSSNGALTLRLNAEQSEIDSLGKQYDDWTDRLTNKEAAIRAQFTAMETALSQSQSMQAQLASQIAGLPSWR